MTRKVVLDAIQVSIHAFRGEGDVPFFEYAFPFLRFNPRLPGGRRRVTSG